MLGEMGPGDNIGLVASKTSATGIRGEYYAIAAAMGKVGACKSAQVNPYGLCLLLTLFSYWELHLPHHPTGWWKQHDQARSIPLLRRKQLVLFQRLYRLASPQN